LENKVDYIIVGGGIGGVCLGLQLLLRKKSFVLFNREVDHSASRVAAGMINPIVVKRIVKSWRADELIPYAENFYNFWSKTLECDFYSKFPLYRIFPGMHEQEQWLEKLKYLEFRDYLSSKIEKFEENYVKTNDAGGADILHCSKIDSLLFLKSCHYLFKENNAYRPESFDYDKLKIESESVIYKEYLAKHILFAEGMGATRNPFFNFLNFYPCKGEVLEIKVENFNPDKGLKKKVFIVPGSNGKFEAGSNYDWHYTDETPTEDGKNAICEGINDILKVDYEITGHRAGIRPAARDRRPFIGKHPDFNHLFCFNGLGTRGYLISPFFSNELIRLCEKEIDSIPECEPARCKKN
jgi:glycine/D-amino acid oxidase-like deaminating enzyme